MTQVFQMIAKSNNDNTTSGQCGQSMRRGKKAFKRRGWYPFSTLPNVSQAIGGFPFRCSSSQILVKQIAKTGMGLPLSTNVI